NGRRADGRRGCPKPPGSTSRPQPQRPRCPGRRPPTRAEALSESSYAQLRRLYLAMNKRGGRGTPPQERRAATLLAQIKDQFRVEVTVRRSAAEAIAYTRSLEQDNDAQVRPRTHGRAVRAQIQTPRQRRLHTRRPRSPGPRRRLALLTPRQDPLRETRDTRRSTIEDE